MLLLKRFDNYRLLYSFRFQNEGKMVSFLNKLKYLSSQSILCQIHCIDFFFQQDLLFGGIPGGSATKQNHLRDFEIFRFQVRFQDFKWDFKRFQDQDFKISNEISRFH